MAKITRKSLVLSTPAKAGTGFKEFVLYVDQYGKYTIEAISSNAVFSRKAAEFECSENDQVHMYFYSILSFYGVKDPPIYGKEFPESFKQYLYMGENAYIYDAYYDKKTDKVVGCYNKKIFFSAKTMQEFNKKSLHIIKEEKRWLWTY